jgi:RNA polymerase sigma-70 factor (ECF subfamily)
MDTSSICCESGWAPSAPPFAPAVTDPKLVAVAIHAPTDEDLMLSYAGGDAAAFEQLYARHRAPLWRFVLRNLRDQTQTADTFQEIWTRVITHRVSYAPRAKFTTWLYRIAHNCCVDHWRRNARKLRREYDCDDETIDALPDDASAGPAELAEQAEAAQALQAAIADLPDEQRAAFLMYVEGGLALPEIAAATGVGAETAKSRLRYATAKLKEALATRMPGGET